METKEKEEKRQWQDERYGSCFVALYKSYTIGPGLLQGLKVLAL